MTYKNYKMKKELLFVGLILICIPAFSQKLIQKKDLPIQSNSQTNTNIGATVILAFNKYDNKGLYGTLLNEENGIITFKFLETDIIGKIDDKGNIMEGADYIKEKKQGKPIIIIQIYETKKKIVNPDIDIVDKISMFTLLETAGGFITFGLSDDYQKGSNKIVLRTKPSSDVIVLQKNNKIWEVSNSNYSFVKKGTPVLALYLYASNTRRFYTSKEGW